ncbi:MAG: phosphate acyltransferase PlsX [Clostridia bacterium]|nr:phosphate acyltransferase PlsX [Clostridia bacterium]
MRILIDAFGGDNSPEQVVIGAIDAVNEKEGFDAVLVGDETKISAILQNLKYDSSRVSVLNASEVITCEEEPTVAIRKKPDSSICVAFKELKENPSAKAFVSAGSTGAVLVGATLKLGRIPGVNRPALCPVMPTITGGQVLLLDAGANADCKAVNLCQFALMGNVYAKINGIENPRIALLSNGTEDEKGNALIHEVLPMLKNIKGINFVGNCEARDILSGKYDVIVADGFSGNVAIKSMEGGIVSVMKLLKAALKKSFKNKLGALLLKKSLYELKDTMDYNKAGGALFIGAKKIVVKAHGSSDAAAIKAAVLQAVKYAQAELTEKLTEDISKVDMSMESL